MKCLLCDGAVYDRLALEKDIYLGAVCAVAMDHVNHHGSVDEIRHAVKGNYLLKLQSFRDIITLVLHDLGVGLIVPPRGDGEPECVVLRADLIMNAIEEVRRAIEGVSDRDSVALKIAALDAETEHFECVLKIFLDLPRIVMAFRPESVCSCDIN